MTALSIVLAVYAVAGEPNAGTSPADEASPETAASAEAIFQRGVDAYDQAQYDTALKLFQDAYRLAPEPSILFNIAQAYRATGDCRKALESLDAVITASGADRSLVNRARGKRDEFERCASTQASPAARDHDVAPASAPRTAAAPAVVLTAPTPPAQVRRSSLLSSSWGKACMVSAGVTFGLGLAGAGLTWAAHDRASVVDDAQIWSPDVQAADSERRGLATAATAALMTSGVLAIVSGTMCWLGWRRRE